jgi:protein-tyrosine phosphatase
MIDLHCHLLPGIDDGAPDLDAALKMARIAADDGIETIACTPHIYPGLFENDTAGIRQKVEILRGHLAEAGIPLKLTWGADAHVAPQLLARLKTGTAPALNDSRYFLLEPPHHVAPPNFAQFTFNFIAAGYVPIITHPERLSWIEGDYDTFCDLADKGVWMQVTAGSLTGRFGQAARYWGERMLDEGRVHILATDAHTPTSRPPLLAEGREAAAKWVGKEEAQHLVETRPLGILRNLAPEAMPALPGAAVAGKSTGLLKRLFGRMAA